MPRKVQGVCRAEFLSHRSCSKQLVALSTYFSTFPLFNFSTSPSLCLNLEVVPSQPSVADGLRGRARSTCVDGCIPDCAGTDRRGQTGCVDPASTVRCLE